MCQLPHDTDWSSMDIQIKLCSLHATCVFFTMLWSSAEWDFSSFMNSYSSCAISFDSPSPFFVSSSKTCKVHVLSRIEHVAFLQAVCMPSQAYLELAVGEERPRSVPGSTFAHPVGAAVLSNPMHCRPQRHVLGGRFFTRKRLTRF